MTLMDKPGSAPSLHAKPRDGHLGSANVDRKPSLAPDLLVLPGVSEYLRRGLALRRWWAEIEQKGGPENTFDIERSFNRPTRSFGFFGEAPVDGKMLPVMGSVQEMFYDHERSPVGQEHSGQVALARIREFAMKYLMRTAAFREPEAYSDASSPVPPPAWAALSWCPRPVPSRMGFGFSQLFNKLAGSELVQAFPSYEQHSIVDQRLIGPIYDWIVLRVHIFDFNIKLLPFGERGPGLVFGENEESYLAVHEEFVNHKDYSESSPRPVGAPSAIGEYGAGHFRPIGDYGIGYAFIKNPIQSIFGFGPGEFDAAIQLINFRIYETGYISVRMVFIANRLQHISNVRIDPVNWGFRMADNFSLGLASRLFSPIKSMLDQVPLRVNLDPVSAYINIANQITGGDASRTLCISKETIERFALLIHFQQHYQTILSTLSTWRQYDWLDPKSLPSWVIAGVGS